MKTGVLKAELTVFTALCLLFVGCSGEPALAGNSLADRVRNDILEMPLNTWIGDEQKAYEGFTVSDLLNERNFYEIRSSVRDNFTDDRSHMYMFRGYINNGEAQDTLVECYILWDARCESPLFKYLGYISEDEQTLREAWGSDDNPNAVSGVLMDLCVFLNLTESEEKIQEQGREEDCDTLENRTSQMRICQELELIGGPISQKTDTGFEVSGVLRTKEPLEEIICVSINFYDADDVLIANKTEYISLHVDCLEKVKFIVDCKDVRCKGYRIDTIETLSVEEALEQKKYEKQFQLASR